MDEEEETRLWFEQELKGVRILGLEPDYADALRHICTLIGIAEHCPFKVCRRAKACATDRVLCWQIMRDDLNPFISRLAAYSWKKSIEEGKPFDIPPVRVDDLTRILAREATGDFASPDDDNEICDTVGNRTGEKS